MAKYFDNYQQFSEVQQTLNTWSLDFKQLSQGSLNASIQGVQLNQCVLFNLCLDKSMDQQGQSPIDYRTFCILRPESTSALINKHLVKHDFIAEFPPGIGFEAVSKAGFDVISIAIEESYFVSVLPESTVCSTSLTVHSVSTQAYALLLDMSACLMESEFTDKMLERRLIETLADIYQKQDLKNISLNHGMRGLITAITYIRENLDEDIAVASLPSVANVSKRTLEYMFSKHLGLTAKQFIIRMKLNMVKQRLEEQGELHSVTHAATDFGFSHLGQFAKDYKQLFAERPSDTKNKQKYK